MSKELYIKLMENNDLSNAYIVAKNIFCRNTGDVDSFVCFAKLGLQMASLDVLLEERKDYLNEVSNSLVVFSEHTEINENVLNIISEYQEQIHNVFEQINDSEEEIIVKMREEAESENTELLVLLGELNEELKQIQSKEEFDKKLVQVTELENKIQKELLSEEQTHTYEVLTKYFSETISSAMERLNKISLIELNKKAIQAFKKAFDEFTSNKSKYKDNESNLKALMVTTLFAFDSRDLLNESLVYYNYVYSMIFNEISNELKYKLTEWSINTDRIKR